MGEGGTAYNQEKKILCGFCLDLKGGGEKLKQLENKSGRRKVLRSVARRGGFLT